MMCIASCWYSKLSYLSRIIHKFAHYLFPTRVQNTIYRNETKAVSFGSYFVLPHCSGIDLGICAFVFVGGSL